MQFLVRIISVFFACVITFYAYVMPVAYADSLIDYWKYGYQTSSFARWSVQAGLQIAGAASDYLTGSPIGTTIATALQLGIDSWVGLEEAGYTEADIYAAEDDYVASLDSTMAYASMSVSGYSCTNVVSSSYGGYKGLSILYNDNVYNLFLTLYGLGVNENVLITACSDSYLAGYFFDENGVFSYGTFVNPFGAANASYLGVYSLSSLDVYLSDSVRWTSGRYSYAYKCYYSKAYAEVQSDFLTTNVLAFDWDSCFTSSLYDSPSVFVFRKYYYDSVWSPVKSLFGVYSVNDAGDIYSMYYPDGGITWNNYVRLVAPSGTDSTTRPASFFQVIDSYNTTNKYIDNSETVNYFIGSTNEGGEVTNIYAPNLFDEETMIFTEPVSGIQYQCTEWKYYYDQRAYVLKLADGSLEYDGQDVVWIGIMYGDDEVIVAGCSAEPTSDSLNLIFSDTYAYVMVAQSECALNGHTYTYETVQEPTCTSPGERKYTCSVCGNEYAEEIPKLDHAYTYTVQQEPDCITPGIWLYTCSLCGDQYTEQVDALGHDWLATENTPTSYALPEDAACPDCGSTDFDFTLDQVSETYSCTCSCGAEWTEQAVVTYGQTTYTCSRCGESYVESEDPDSGLFASIGNFIANGIDWIVDKLVQLIDSIAGINEIFTEYVEQMKEKAGEYPAFISAFIAIMPEDLMTVFWFGVIAAVVLAVWKKWFN